FFFQAGDGIRDPLVTGVQTCALPISWEAGIRAFIVLDLARVGSGEGPRLDAARALRRAFPAAEVLIGGGVRDHADLDALASEGRSEERRVGKEWSLLWVTLEST